MIILLAELHGFVRQQSYFLNSIYIIVGIDLIFIYLILKMRKNNNIINNGTGI